ncbi:MAG: hypothetical protein DI535_25260 [Citrobacter freundii]|nr:MAG: hypothetical protein DI535_25260 [Citrobacter freundii]
MCSDNCQSGISSNRGVPGSGFPKGDDELSLPGLPAEAWRRRCRDDKPVLHFFKKFINSRNPRPPIRVLEPRVLIRRLQ